MADNKISMPSGFGGLMRYDDEQTSKVQLKPIHVLIFVILIVGFRVLLPIIFPNI